MKHFKILLLIFGVMLSSTISYAQSKVKCTYCKNGIATWSETVSCTNCKSWADSYRKIKGCVVCKNNKVITIRKQAKCSACKGTTWRIKSKEEIAADIAYEKQQQIYELAAIKEQQIYKKLNELKLYPDRNRHIGYFRINDDRPLAIALYRIKYDRSENNLWYVLGAIMTNDLSYATNKEKVYALLDYFELMYNYARKSDGWAGCRTFYPNPDEVKFIRYELERLNADQNYKPDFFGMGVTASDLIRGY